MLTRVAINNYNCLVDFELKDVPRRLLLVGSNGSGKSSLWEALVALQDLIVRGTDVTDAFPTRTLTRWLGEATKQRFDFDVRVGENTYTYILELEHDTRKQIAAVSLEQVNYLGRSLYHNDSRGG